MARFIGRNTDVGKQSEQPLPYTKQKSSFREFQINDKAMRMAFYSSGGLATPSQLSFIKNLAAEKRVNKIFEVTGIAVPENKIPTKQQAAAIIQKLIAI